MVFGQQSYMIPEELRKTFVFRLKIGIFPVDACEQYMAHLSQGSNKIENVTIQES